MTLQETFTLTNGQRIPKIGFGTWRIKNDDVVAAVKSAIDSGYRHIDTAQAYQNEQGVGKAIHESNIDRKELYVTTKLAAEIKSYDEAVEAIDESLEKLGLEYIDLMLIHSPKPWMKYKGDERFFEGNREAWRALEDAYEAGKLKAIGVSNFLQPDIDNIIDHCRIKPQVNQVLAHISNTPFELIEYCKGQDILVEAYSPIGHGALLKNEEIAKMADRYGVTVPQLGIRYDLQLGLLPLPKSANPDHIRSNAKVDYEISSEDMDRHKSMEKIKDYGEASKFPVFG